MADTLGVDAPKELAMRQARRWTVLLAVLLVAASPIFAPHEGRAGPVGGRSILPMDPRPTPELGEPDTPSDPGPLVSVRLWIPCVLVTRGFLIDVPTQDNAPASLSRMNTARCAPRSAVGP